MLIIGEGEWHQVGVHDGNESSKDSRFSSLTKNTSKSSLDSVTTPPDKDMEEAARIAKLRRHALLQQRPTNPEIMCCDYTAAEKAAALGIEGKRAFGGAHLCLQCLGEEVRDEFDDLAPILPPTNSY
jgi:hypothetical protein